MPDEHRLDRVLRIERRFKGQHTQHQVYRLAHGPHPPLSPGPDLRTDVLHRGQAAALEPARQAQVERRGIDAHEDIRRIAQELAQQAGTQAIEPRQVPQRLDEPHDGDFFGTGQRLAAGGPHARAGHPDKAGVGMQAAERLDEGRAEQVSGCLARHQRDAQRPAHGVNGPGCAWPCR